MLISQVYDAALLNIYGGRVGGGGRRSKRARQGERKMGLSGANWSEGFRQDLPYVYEVGEDALRLGPATVARRLLPRS